MLRVTLQTLDKCRQTRSGVAGIANRPAPTLSIASSTAAAKQDKPQTVPDSPAPFMPNGLVGVGTSLVKISQNGTLSAFGNA